MTKKMTTKLVAAMALIEQVAGDLPIDGEERREVVKIMQMLDELITDSE